MIEVKEATGPLRATQLRMLEILIEIDKVCRKYDIPYWLEYGSLLGAVRHGGSIPWDDDTDICVPEDSFDVFIETCQAELPDWLYVQTEKTDPKSGMGAGLIKIRDKRSLYIHEFEAFGHDYNKGIFVDVFKCVKYRPIPKRIYKYLSLRISYAWGFYHYHPLLNMGNIVRYFLYPFSYVWHKLLLNILNIGKKNYCYVTPERYTYGMYSKESDIFPLRDISYEGVLLKAPCHAEQHLTDIYGDYMQLPTPEKRRTHAKFVFTDLNLGVVQYEN